VYYDIADCIVIMYDVTQKESFDSIDTWLNSVKTLTNKQPEIILVGNKIKNSKEMMIRKKLELKYARNKGMHLQEIEVLDASATKDLLEKITTYVIRKRKNIPSPVTKPIPRVKTEGMSCCVT